MTASVYFIGLFSSNTHSLLRCSLLSLIWCSLAQQKQQIVKMRSWRTRRRLRLCVCAELPVRGAAPHPHPHPRVARAAASPVPRRTSAETESQRAPSQLRTGSAAPKTPGEEQNPHNVPCLQRCTSLAGPSAWISAAAAAAVLCLPSSMSSKGLLVVWKHAEITGVGSSTPSRWHFQNL